MLLQWAPRTLVYFYMTLLLVFIWPSALCFWAVFIAAFGPESRVVSG